MSHAVYDVVIVGAGPAGIFAGLEIARRSSLRVLVIEKGRDIKGRRCPASERKAQCVNCDPCGIISGWGGAGAFSDGKLTLCADVGGMLDTYIGRADLLNSSTRWTAYTSTTDSEKVYGEHDERSGPCDRQAGRHGACSC